MVVIKDAATCSPTACVSGRGPYVCLRLPGVLCFLCFLCIHTHTHTHTVTLSKSVDMWHFISNLCLSYTSLTFKCRSRYTLESCYLVVRYRVSHASPWGDNSGLGYVSHCGECQFVWKPEICVMFWIMGGGDGKRQSCKCREGINFSLALRVLRASESHSLICLFLFNIDDHADTVSSLERGLSVRSTTGKSNHLNSLAGSVLMSCL